LRTTDYFCKIRIIIRLSEQQTIVSEIEKIEEQMAVLEQKIAEIPKQKEAILKRYL